MKKKKPAAALAVILFLSACGSSADQLRNIPRSERKGLAVLNYYNGTPRSRAMEFGPWEFGLASMVMTDIEAIGQFNIISKERLKGVIREQELQMTGLVDEKSVVKIGRIVGAAYILTGSFTEMNGTLRIETQVYSVERGTQMGTASVTGRTDGFFELEKELVAKVSKFLNVMLTEEERGKIAARVETKSVKASLSNYRGEIEVEKARDLVKEGKKQEAKRVIETAKESFQQAVQIDPAYQKARKNLSRISLAIPVTL